MATFGSYTLPRTNTNSSKAPAFSSYADYSYSRTSNSTLSVTVTVTMKYTGTGGTVGAGTGASITATMSCGGVSGTETLKAAGTGWNMSTNQTYTASTTLSVPSSSAGTTMTVSYSISNGGASWVTFATVPAQSTTFSSPALLYTNPTVSNLSVAVSRTTATMTWSASAGTNNSIVRYHVNIINVTNNVSIVSTTTTSASYTLTGCGQGIIYRFSVYGEGKYSNSATITKDITIPYFGLVYIDNGSTFEAYQVFIDNGSSWDQYIPYIDNGSGWDECN